MYDIVIVGAGPAGLTAALFGARSNKKVLLLEGNVIGGQIINASKIDNYPGIISISGKEYINNLLEQVKSYNVEIKYEIVKMIREDKTIITDNSEYKANSVIIATGVNNKKLGIENEDKLIGSGVSYCATCDGNFFKDKEVAVVGGGSTALSDALYLSDICSKVYLIHRRSEFRAPGIIVKKVMDKDNIELVLDSNVTKLIGDNYLTGVEVNNNNIINVSGLFIAIGQVPNNKIFDNLVDIDEKGYIITHDDVYTKTPWLYVAGDTREKTIRQLTTAVSDGTIAALAAIKNKE